MRMFDIEIWEGKGKQIKKAIPESRLPWDVMAELERFIKRGPNAYLVIRQTPESAH